MYFFVQVVSAAHKSQAQFQKESKKYFSSFVNNKTRQELFPLCDMAHPKCVLPEMC